jgi:K(+)-stimulated pyrophosphate-energized sodium pump
MIATIFAISLIGIVVAYFLARSVLNQGTGTDKMREIAKAIQEGAEAFLKRQYTTITILSVSLAVIIFLIYFFVGNIELGWKTAFSFILGAFASGLAGYIGMYVSVRANIRTAAAAQTSLNKALQTALRCFRHLGCSSFAPWSSGALRAF